MTIINSIKPSGLILIAVAILVAFLANGFYKIAANEEGVVLFFGKINRINGPGLYYKLPYPIESLHVRKVSEINQETVGASNSGTTRSSVFRGRSASPVDDSFVLTGDINVVNIEFVVQWRINNISNYLFNVKSDTVSPVKDVSLSAIREIVALFPLNSVLARERLEIENRTKARIQKTLDSYKSGISIERVQLQSSDPPEEVIDAFREVEAARAERETLVNKAESYYNKMSEMSKGEVEKVLEEAKAYSQSKIAIATGKAKKFNIMHEAYISSGKSNDNDYKEMFKELFYLDGIGDVISGIDKFVIDSDSALLPHLAISDKIKRS